MVQILMVITIYQLRPTSSGFYKEPALLNKYSPLPLYHQLKTAIEERIDSGEWSPGMQVPPERELCEQFAVSRITVRRALSELEARGRLTRKQGVGTAPGSTNRVYPGYAGQRQAARHKGLTA
jgi:DNA-binding GntR family transcriptional regulator